MKATIPTAERVRQLFVWMQRYQPHIGAGLIRRFTPREQLAGLGGIFDFIGTAVQGVTNFAQTQGFDKLLTAAQPFIKNAAEKSALKVQLERIKAGLPPAAEATAASSPGGQGTPGATPGGVPASEPWYKSPWVFVAGGAALIGTAALFLGGRSGRRA